MRKDLLFLFILLAISSRALSVTVTVTNNGNTFSPLSVTISLGDEVDFDVEGIHQATEVSQQTWDDEGDTPIGGGFITPFGGGLVTADKLPVGVHYYVCSNHVSMGMKGIITVEDTGTGMAPQPILQNVSVYPNPVADLLSVKATCNAPGTMYMLTDMSGKNVLSGKLSGELTRIDLTSLAPGNYLLQLADKKDQTFRIEKR